MKNKYGQYPEIYSTDDARYTYFYDNGERVTLIAGENGVTKEWIHALKLEHRKEYNMMRQGARTDTSARVFSLDQYKDDADDKSDVLTDPNADVESNYIAGLEATERRERIKEALASLTPEQRELLIRVRVKNTPIVVVANEQGVTSVAILDRLKRIENKFLKFLK